MRSAFSAVKWFFRDCFNDPTASRMRHSRRDFLTRAGGGMGLLALMAAAGAGRPAPTNRREPAGAEAAALPGGREKRHLVLPRRRPQPHRPVRPQAGTEEAGTASRCRRRSSGRSRRWAAPPTRRCWRPSAPSSSTADSGQWVSDWYPEIASCADDLAVLRSCHADGLNHVGSVCQMNTGSVLGGRPCLGSWSLYGLGSASQEPARLRRAARQRGGPARRQPQLGHRLHAGHLPGHPLPRRQDAHSVSRSARRMSRRPGSGPSSTSSRN